MSAAELTRVLDKIVKDLEKTTELLTEVDNMGLWVSSDDCSDNRRKRTALREADWAVSGSVRRIAAVLEQNPSVRPVLAALQAQLDALVKTLEPMPDLVTDWMGKDRDFDMRVSRVLDDVERAMTRTRELRAKLPDEGR